MTTQSTKWTCSWWVPKFMRSIMPISLTSKSSKRMRWSREWNKELWSTWRAHSGMTSTNLSHFKNSPTLMREILSTLHSRSTSKASWRNKCFALSWLIWSTSPSVKCILRICSSQSRNCLECTRYPISNCSRATNEALEVSRNSFDSKSHRKQSSRITRSTSTSLISLCICLRSWPYSWVTLMPTCKIRLPSS